MDSRGMRQIALGLIVAVVLGLAAVGASAQGENRIPVIVGFQRMPDAAAVRRAGGTVKRTFHLVPAVAASLPAKAIAALQRNPKVAYVESDRILHSLYQPGETVPWGIDRIGAPIVYAAGNAGNGVPVAVLDTGIDTSHPDLAINYVGGYDFVWNDSVPDDENGHGTHVSGTIAAADNGVGIVGVGPEIALYALKFLDSTGSGYTSDEIAAIEWAVDQGIKVLNMSYGSYYRSRTEERALKRAYEQGMLLVAACGNDGNAWKLYPATYKCVIAVAATDQGDNRAYFSNYYKQVELAAPGVDILSSMPTYWVYLNWFGYLMDYDYLSGTSMASPHVAGTAALVFCQNPTWTSAQVREQLTSTATDIGAPGKDSEFGYGLINAEAACGTPPPPPPPPPGTGTITGTVYRNGATVAKANVSLIDQSGNLVANTKTSKSGVYTFTDVPADYNPATYYIVSARSRKYTDTSGAIDLEPDQTVVQDLNLQ